MNPNRRTAPLIAGVVLAVVVAVAFAVSSRDDGSVNGAQQRGTQQQAQPRVPGSSAAESIEGTPPDPQTMRATAAETALNRLELAVESRDEQGFSQAFDASAQDEARHLFATLDRLPLESWELRFIAEESRAATTWVGDVEARWSLDGFDDREVVSEVDVTFVQTGEQASIGAIERADAGRTPEWLLGETDVRQSRDTLVISARPALTDGVVAHARQAVQDVREVVTSSTEPVVVVVPADTVQLEKVLAGEAGSYDSIAAVTATADGTADERAPVRIVLNPPVFERLGRLGAQVVMSHEATHAATGATATQIPLWLVEGFADYVALADEPVPLEVAAEQILQQVREGGPPRRLPRDADFESTSGRLGANYEAAWLACRMIADQWGEPTLVRFYERALVTGNIKRAVRRVLRTDTADLTSDWRGYLDELA